MKEMTSPQTKKCPSCKDTKSFSEFHKDKNQKGRYPGIKVYCKKCCIERAKTYLPTRRVNNQSESVKASKRRWYANNRRTAKAINVKWRFGISIDEYEDRIASAKGICEICKEFNEKPLFLDHDHSSGNLRGVLCLHCNAALGFFRDNQDSLERAIVYLKNYSS